MINKSISHRIQRRQMQRDAIKCSKRISKLNRAVIEIFKLRSIVRDIGILIGISVRYFKIDLAKKYILT